KSSARPDYIGRLDYIMDDAALKFVVADSTLTYISLNFQPPAFFLIHSLNNYIDMKFLDFKLNHGPLPHILLHFGASPDDHHPCSAHLPLYILSFYYRPFSFFPAGIVLRIMEIASDGGLRTKLYKLGKWLKKISFKKSVLFHTLEEIVSCLCLIEQSNYSSMFSIVAPLVTHLARTNLLRHEEVDVRFYAISPICHVWKHLWNGSQITFVFLLGLWFPSNDLPLNAVRDSPATLSCPLWIVSSNLLAHKSLVEAPSMQVSS
ncbi:hypothetical protein KI387_020367, partial [Taxus chinensis]